MIAVIGYLLFFGLAVADSVILGRAPVGGPRIYTEAPPLPQIIEQWKKGIDVFKGPFQNPVRSAGYPMSDMPGGLPELRRPSPSLKRKGVPGTPGSPLGPQKKPGRVYPPCSRKRNLCVPASRQQLLKLADSVTDQEFSWATKEFRLKLPKDASGKVPSATQLSVRIKASGVAKSIVGTKFGWLKGTGKAFARIGVAFFAMELVNVLVTNSTRSEKVVAVTSFIPFLGCVVQYEEQRKQNNNKVNAGQVAALILCEAGDACLLHPTTFGLGLILKGIYALTSALSQPHESEVERLERERDAR